MGQTTTLTELADTEHRALWDRLSTLDLDDWAEGAGPARFGFTARLARDNGWSAAFAERVVEEYRRFVFLSQVLGHPVTPSDEVDQAWHLHLTYTRSYWDDLCGQVLGRPLHHGPTRGGPAEDTKFEDWYARTLDGYRAWFGTEPPADVWPPSSIRFGEAPYWVRVNTRRQLVIDRSRLPGRRHGRAGLLAGGSLLLAGCTGVGTIGLLAQDGGGAGGVIIIVILVSIFAIAALTATMTGRAGRPTQGQGEQSRRQGTDGGGCGGGGCGADAGGGGCGGGGCGGGCGGGG
ncbi:MAG: hypothetical protein AAF547_08870 [Actinomycetota bacterium]